MRSVAARALESAFHTVAFDNDNRRHGGDSEAFCEIGSPEDIDANNVERVVVSTSLQHCGEVPVDTTRRPIGR